MKSNFSLILFLPPPATKRKSKLLTYLIFVLFTIFTFIFGQSFAYEKVPITKLVARLKYNSQDMVEFTK